ncbi:ABC transporter permease [Poritiphilus flavus]|uniref:Ribose ABC transporter permease n=1 Tax=Poritiphilus flavus TaxID=2697053 RepID=A0A6L9E7G0_9FLAO|nr:ABC transporter permease [Poritiphilus flavus]NAS10620.1 ribose ABC transporter permease [Poritiphilus flavus]
MAGISNSKSGFIIYLCVGYYLIMAVLAPGFFTLNNTMNLLFNLLPLLIIAIGQTYVMLTAGIDLSVTSIVAMCSVLGGFMMSSDTGLFQSEFAAILFGISTMLLGGALIGTINGFAVAKLGMPAFMVTLTTMILFSGLAIWLTQSQNLYNLPEAFIDMPYTSLLGIPIPVYVGLLVVLVAYFLLNRTIFGEWIYAVGANTKTAKISGVNVPKTIVLVYVFSGLCAAVGAILYTARLETGSPVMGQNILLDVIGAVVIGGTSLFGGKGKIAWTFFGALFMTLLDNSLNLLNLSFFIIMVVKGSVILGAAILNTVLEKSLKAT